MKYALISDIHANLPALEAVLADIDREAEVDTIYHLGDLVGYAPWPNEVVALIRERGLQGIAGNYDSTTATDYPHAAARPTAPEGRNSPTSPTSVRGRTSPPKPSAS
jgi:predicted phosphodiesterase